MTVLQIIFYSFSTVAVLSGLMVVASNNPVRGALFLVLTFFAMCGVWLLLEAEFLALVLVLVYVGAVMTLFLFVVMMLRVNVVSLFEGFVRYLPIVILIIAALAGLVFLVIGPKHFGLTMIPLPEMKPVNYSNIQALGMLLYTNYVYPFEIAAVLLLTAIIAAIALSHRQPKDRKIQKVSQQVAVERKDRIRIIKMPAEKKVRFSHRGQL